MLRIGATTICALAVLAGSFELKRNATSDIRDRQPSTAPATVTTLARTIDIISADDRRRMTPAGAGPASEFLPQSDTTGLLQESLSIDDLLDEVNADPGPGFVPVDRDRFAAMLRSDPELRKAILE
jgi:hypothetical protein